MKLQQLQAFVAAAHHRSLRAAARELGVTQPAVTHTIRELESALNAELMVRSVRGIELTACGLALLPRAEQLLGDMRRTVEAVEQVKGELAGKVSVGTMPSIALTALPHAVSSFRRENAAGQSAHRRSDDSGRARAFAQRRARHRSTPSCAGARQRPRASAALLDTVRRRDARRASAFERRAAAQNCSTQNGSRPSAPISFRIA